MIFKRKQLENGSIFADKPRIILVGNPNVGKSLIFNSLTGRYVTVSNYPGTTVDITKGLGRIGSKNYLIIDTPGINSLLAQSEDEEVTRNVLLSEAPSIVIQVIDSKNLRRSLSLTMELIEFGLPLIIDLNMSDEARERGIVINMRKLREILGVEIVETVATTKQGIEALKKAVGLSNISHFSIKQDSTIEEAIAQIQNILPSWVKSKRQFSLTALCGDISILSVVRMDEEKIKQIKNTQNSVQKKYSKPLKLVIAAARQNEIEEIAGQVITISKPLLTKTFRDLISRLALMPFTAVPLAMLLIYLMYKFVGQFAARTAVDFMEEVIFGKFLNPWVGSMVFNSPLPQFLKEFLVGNYGIVTMALTYALAIILPIVSAFFLFFGILEDSGYLPRLCVLLDRLFHPLGLNGRAVLPMVLGLGCGTMATLTARTLETRKERILVTLILSLAVPCSAQLGVIMGMLGGIGAFATSVWLLTIMLSGFLVSFLAAKIIPGERSMLIQEIPPIRIPQISNILIKTWARLKWYLKEAVPLFILGTVILFVLDKSGILIQIEEIFRPVVVSVLNLPSKVSEALLVGFLRRDYGAAGLFVLRRTGQLDNIQTVVSLIVITLFVPCIAQLFVAIKERGIKVALAIFSFTVFFAFLAGGAVNFILRHFKVVF